MGRQLMGLRDRQRSSEQKQGRYANWRALRTRSIANSSIKRSPYDADVKWDVRIRQAFNVSQMSECGYSREGPLRAHSVLMI